MQYHPLLARLKRLSPKKKQCPNYIMMNLDISPKMLLKHTYWLLFFMDDTKSLSQNWANLIIMPKNETSATM